MLFENLAVARSLRHESLALTGWQTFYQFALTPYALRLALTPYALRLTPYALRRTTYDLRLTTYDGVVEQRLCFHA